MAAAARERGRDVSVLCTGLEARTYGPSRLEDDVRRCAQESALDVVPQLGRMVGSAAEIVAGAR